MLPPNYCIVCLFLLGSVCGSNPGIYVQLSDYIVFAKLTNSLVNPVIYAITTSQFRLSLTTLLNKVFLRPGSNNKRFSATTATTRTSSKS